MPGRTERLSKERYRVYLERAIGLNKTMESAMRSGESHGAALSAVHSAIAVSDALSVFYLGERARAQDHREVLALVNRLPVAGAAEQARHLSSILGWKTETEYGSSRLTARETERLVAQARRFVKWATENLPSP